MIFEKFAMCIGEVANCYDSRTIIDGVGAARIVCRAPFAKRRLSLGKRGFSILDGLNFRIQALRSTTKRILLQPHRRNENKNQHHNCENCPDEKALG